jgi:hypothetical protein
MFDALIADAGHHEKRFTVYAADDTSGVEARFGDTGISIDHRPLPPYGPEPFVVIYDGGDFAGALSLGEFEELLVPPVVRPGDRGSISAGYRALFDVLDDTVFSSLDRRQLLGASREIEDRAFRVGHGVLRVSFQRFSAFDAQTDVYRQLAGKAGLDVHAYGSVPDRDPPDIDGLSYHASTDPSVERYWALAFDGGINEQQACGLLAREHDDTYTGFWTYDPGIVGTILDELESLDEDS